MTEAYPAWEGIKPPRHLKNMRRILPEGSLKAALALALEDILQR